MAEYLCKHSSGETAVIDYGDGFIHTYLADTAHRFLPYDGTTKTAVDDSVVVVTSLSFLAQINTMLNLSEDTRLFFWDLHPYNLVENLALSKVYKKISVTHAGRLATVVEPVRRAKLARAVDEGLASSGLVFMAERNYSFNRALLGIARGPTYLPLPIDARHGIHVDTSIGNYRYVNGASVEIGWLSRLAPDKMAALLRLMRDVQEYQQCSGDRSVRVHIIGDGGEAARIAHLAISLGIEVKMPGRIDGHSLTEYVRRNVDIGFGMGTSALEFAARGIPTVLTLGSFHEDFNLPKPYRWLFDAEGYNVSSEAGTGGAAVRGFSDIIEDYSVGRAADLGENCLKYVWRNHEISHVALRFKELLASCSFTYGSVRGTGIYQFSAYEKALFALKRVVKQRLA
jgi:hypothetical protein